jgi:hypothetical protein
VEDKLDRRRVLVLSAGRTWGMTCMESTHSPSRRATGALTWMRTTQGASQAICSSQQTRYVQSTCRNTSTGSCCCCKQEDSTYRRALEPGKRPRNLRSQPQRQATERREIESCCRSTICSSLHCAMDGQTSRMGYDQNLEATKKSKTCESDYSCIALQAFTHMR